MNAALLCVDQLVHQTNRFSTSLNSLVHLKSKILMRKYQENACRKYLKRK